MKMSAIRPMAWRGLGVFVPCLMVAPAWGQYSSPESATIGVTVQVLPACNAGTTGSGGGISFGTLNFGSYYALNSVIHAIGQQNSGGIRVNCVSGIPYRILMSGGLHGTVPQRYLQGGSGNQLVGYNLYTDATYATVWDNTTGVSSTSTGSDQWFNVYGQVPAQATPLAGTYTDSVTVTVSW